MLDDALRAGGRIPGIQSLVSRQEGINPIRRKRVCWECAVLPVSLHSWLPPSPNDVILRTLFYVQSWKKIGSLPGRAIALLFPSAVVAPVVHARERVSPIDKLDTLQLATPSISSWILAGVVRSHTNRLNLQNTNLLASWRCYLNL